LAQAATGSALTYLLATMIIARAFLALCSGLLALGMDDATTFPDDECSSSGCALYALQRRASSMTSGDANNQDAQDRSIPGIVDPDLSDLLPDPDGSDDDDDDDDELPNGDEAGSNLCNGKEFDRSQEGCCGNVLYDLTSHSCCGQDVYDIEEEDCCGGTTVYNTSSQGCCNKKEVFSLGAEYLTFGLHCLPDVKPTEHVEFACASEWPPANYAQTWRRYCAAKIAGEHMAWAMTPSCQVGWLSVKQASEEKAQEEAKLQCQSKADSYNDETCHVFDTDGRSCSRQRCGTTLYDATLLGCCNGVIFDLRTQDCCSGRVYDTRTTGCCRGKLFHKEPRRCCGGKYLFNSNTHGCCLEKGPQVFRFGSQNCCASPAGICKIPPGIESCCKREGTW